MSNNQKQLQGTYNHAYTLAFAVPASEHEDWYECLQNEKEKVIGSLERRLQMIRDNDQEFMEALEGFDTYGEQEDETTNNKGEHSNE
jgi:hypothetical protein